MNFVNFVHNSRERSPLSGLLILIGFVCIGFVLAGIIQFALLIPELTQNENIDFDHIDMSLLMESRSGWWRLVLMQGLSSLLMFTLVALAYWKWVEHKSFQDFNSNYPSLPSVFFSVILLEILITPFMSWVGKLNQNMHFPEALAGLEAKFKSMEESAAELTNYLAKSNTIAELLANLIVIAVIAGIGEELIFRGLIQRKLMKLFNNYHVAIWVAAALFSAIHFQFYGFFPRLFLGALFGYLYVWTGNIWVPIFAHILNNGLAVIIYHLINKEVLSPEMEKMENTPWYFIVLFTPVFAVILSQFYRRYVR